MTVSVKRYEDIEYFIDIILYKLKSIINNETIVLQEHIFIYILSSRILRTIVFA
jgi:hypothetical protein